MKNNSVKFKTLVMTYLCKVYPYVTQIFQRKPIKMDSTIKNYDRDKETETKTETETGKEKETETGYQR